MAARSNSKKSPARKTKPKTARKTTRKTASKATSKTARKTASKARAKATDRTPSLSLESLRESMNAEGLRKGMVTFQKRGLEAQKRAVDLGLDAMMNVERRQRDVVLDMLEGAERVPGEVREFAAAWADFRLARQEAYKQALDQSYSLAHRYLDGVAETSAS